MMLPLNDELPDLGCVLPLFGRGLGVCLYRDLPSLWQLFWSRQRDFEDTVVKLGLRLFRIGSLGQRKAAVKISELAFAAANAPIVGLALHLTLPLQNERTVFHFHAHFIGRQPWKLGEDAVLSIAFGDFDGRHPGNIGTGI